MCNEESYPYFKSLSISFWKTVAGGNEKLNYSKEIYQ